MKLISPYRDCQTVAILVWNLLWQGQHVLHSILKLLLQYNYRTTVCFHMSLNPAHQGSVTPALLMLFRLSSGCPQIRSVKFYLIAESKDIGLHSSFNATQVALLNQGKSITNGSSFGMLPILMGQTGTDVLAADMKANPLSRQGLSAFHLGNMPSRDGQTSAQLFEIWIPIRDDNCYH